MPRASSSSNIAARAPPTTPKQTQQLSTLQQLKETPITSSKSLGSGVSVVPTPARKEKHNMYAEDFEGRCWGDINPKDWMKQFVPKAPRGTQLDEITWPSDLTEKSLAEATNASLGESLAERSVFPTDTHHAGGSHDGFKLRPDFSLLLERFPSLHGKSKLAKQHAQYRDMRLLGSVLVFGELKPNLSDDPFFYFKKGGDKPIEDSEATRQTRGQLIKCAHAVLANSHRTFLLGFVTFASKARLLYFDHGGIIYSAAFEWRTESYLADLFQRMALAEADDRGFDSSVSSISASHSRIDDAKAIFAEAKESGCIPAPITWDTTFTSSNYPAAKYWLADVYDEGEGKFHQFLFDKPQTSPELLRGRFTRGYVGVDLTAKRVAYMKRSWRIDADGIEREYDVYKELEKQGVPHLPGLYCGGDVPASSANLVAKYGGAKPKKLDRNKVTPLSVQSSAYAEKHKLSCRLTSTSQRDETLVVEKYRHVLHVQLFSKIGVPLHQFQQPLDLFLAARDAIQCHYLAHKNGYLHRDISIGNILIYPSPGRKIEFKGETLTFEVEGLLIDWDLCTSTKRREHARRQGRTGTWEFLSVRILENPCRQPHRQIDDLESFVHVLNYTALHYIRVYDPSNMTSRRALLSEFQQVFSRQVPTEENATDNKARYLHGQSGAVTKALGKLPLPLKGALSGLRKMFAPFYVHVLPSDEDVPAPDSAAWDEQLAAKALPPAAEVTKTCSHAAMIAVLESYMFHPKARPGWPTDPSEDQFPGYLLKETSTVPATREMPLSSTTSAGTKRPNSSEAEVSSSRPNKKQNVRGKK